MVVHDLTSFQIICDTVKNMYGFLGVALEHMTDFFL